MHCWMIILRLFIPLSSNVYTTFNYKLNDLADTDDFPVITSDNINQITVKVPIIIS